MATVTQKEKDGSTTLKYVPDVPGPGEPTVPVPPAGANPPPANAGSNAAGQPGEWQTGADGMNRFVPTGTPISRTIDTPADVADTFLNTFQQPETAAQIAERKRKGAQDLIDSTNKLYDTELASAKEAGQKRLDQNNAINIIYGLMGSTEAVRTDRTVTAANQKEQDAINAKRQVALATIYNKISQDADAEALQQKEDATKSAEAIVARRKQSQTEAVNNLTLMAKSGAIDFDAFKNSPQNAKVYQYALDAVGGSEDALRGLFAANRPQDQLVGEPIRVGDHFIQGYKNPLSGKVSYDTITVPGGLPAEYNSFQKLGDNIVAIPDGWDGDPSKLKTIAGQPSTIERLQQQALQLQIQKTQQELTANDPAAAASKAADQKAQALQLAQELYKSDTAGKASAVGASLAKLVPFGQSLGLQGDRTAFEAKVNTLKSNLTLDNLKLLKGAMSDKDLLFLNSIGSSLDTNMTETQFNSELERVIGKLGGLPAVVQAKGYDYDAMKADGHSDDEIKSSLGIK